jgi:aminoglycoside N3'-acetyltransferase
VIADQQWKTVQEEDHQNKELLELSRQILVLTKEVRALAVSNTSASGALPDPPRK